MIRSSWLAFILVGTVAIFSCSDPEPEYELFYIGTYTGSGSEGIHTCLLNIETGELTQLELSCKTENPSFLAVLPNEYLQNTVVAVNEGSDFGNEATGAISTFSVQERGPWQLKGQTSSKGASPCHISIDHSRKFVFVANYMGGIAAYRLDENGSPGELTAMIEHQGSGPDQKRQRRPHPHFIQATPNNKFVLVADLGIDKVIIYDFNPQTGSLSANDPPFADLPPGSGPRHLVTNTTGTRVYVLNELNSTITYFDMDTTTGTLTSRQTVSTLPTGLAGANTAAEIALDSHDDVLYASNRGHDSIVVYEVKGNSGELIASSWTSTGKGPRHFSMDLTGRWLLVASQYGNSINVFEVNHEERKLEATPNAIEINSPVCIKFAGGRTTD
jgi:6-phosphogluconolactonase